MLQAELGLKRLAPALQIVLGLLEGGLAILRVKPFLELPAVVGQVLVGVAQHGLPARGEIDLVGLEVPVPQAIAGAKHGHFEAQAAFLQRHVARLDLTDHVIERPGQLADLVPAASLGTDRVILVHGDGAHHAGQLLNGIGDEALQAR